MLNTLNIEDRHDFKARLARHELRASLVQDRLQANGGGITRIGFGSGRFKPLAIPVNSVATLTKMFGVPDQLLNKEASKNVARVVNWKPKTNELQRVMDSKTLAQLMRSSTSTLSECTRICCKNSLTTQDIGALTSSSRLWNVAKIFFATEPRKLLKAVKEFSHYIGDNNTFTSNYGDC
jgi:hypothetical protein